jgi:hypothetical protein
MGVAYAKNTSEQVLNSLNSVVNSTVQNASTIVNQSNVNTFCSSGNIEIINTQFNQSQYASISSENYSKVLSNGSINSNVSQRANQIARAIGQNLNFLPTTTIAINSGSNIINLANEISSTFEQNCSNILIQNQGVTATNCQGAGDITVRGAVFNQDQVADATSKCIQNVQSVQNLTSQVEQSIQQAATAKVESFLSQLISILILGIIFLAVLCFTVFKGAKSIIIILIVAVVLVGLYFLLAFIFKWRPFTRTFQAQNPEFTNINPIWVNGVPTAVSSTIRSPNSSTLTPCPTANATDGQQFRCIYVVQNNDNLKLKIGYDASKVSGFQSISLLNGYGNQIGNSSTSQSDPNGDSNVFVLASRPSAGEIQLPNGRSNLILQVDNGSNNPIYSYNYQIFVESVYKITLTTPNIASPNQPPFNYPSILGGCTACSQLGFSVIDGFNLTIEKNFESQIQPQSIGIKFLLYAPTICPTQSDVPTTRFAFNSTNTSDPSSFLLLFTPPAGTTPLSSITNSANYSIPVPVDSKGCINTTASSFLPTGNYTIKAILYSVAPTNASEEGTIITESDAVPFSVSPS